MKGKVILTSFGFNTKTGYELLEAELKKDGDLSQKEIFLFYEPYFFLQERILWACEKLGFRKENLLLSGRDTWPEDGGVDYVFVGEGNTFESMRILRDRGLFEKIQKACTENGTTYIGASAGAVIAGKGSIGHARMFDKEETYLEGWEKKGLGLVDGIIFPHVASLDELSGLDMESLLQENGNGTIMPYVIPNDGIVVFPADE